MSDQEEYVEAGQGHVLTFLDTLPNEAEQEDFKNQLASINPTRVNGLYKAALKADSLATSTEAVKLEPPPEETFASLVGSEFAGQSKEWATVGIQAIQKGQVGVILLAGGQGTRLGSSDPKGCYDIGLPSNKSLFQLQAERIKAVQALAGQGSVVPWYIMTSGPTRAPTEAFFEAHKFFGLDKKNVIFFEQGVLPCLDNEGKILLDTKSSVAVAPDGNGGLYAGLFKAQSSKDPSSVLDDMKARGIQYLHTHGVDNCLVRVADPAFVGYCINKQADCGNVVVRKTQPEESVGVIALRNGKWGVVEYSEIPASLSQAKTPSGELVFRAANIANHFFTVEFLDRIQALGEDDMPFHIARKKIPYVDLKSGERIKPTKPNGMKLELFIFDVFPFSQNMAVLEVQRQDFFSPLKNAPNTGVDDPQTSRADLLAQHKRWIEAAGGDAAGHEIELAPGISYAGEGLEVIRGRKASAGGVVESKQDLEKLFA